MVVHGVDEHDAYGRVRRLHFDLLRTEVGHTRNLIPEVRAGRCGGRTRQFSLRREMAPQVRRWLANYQRLKQSIEAICELNHELLRPDEAAAGSRRKGS